MSEMTMEDEGRKPFGMITRFLVFCAGATSMAMSRNLSR